MAKKQREIDIIIHEDGKVEADALGYQGKGCAEDIDEILNNVGKTVKSKKKSEFNDEQKVRTSQQR